MNANWPATNLAVILVLHYKISVSKKYKKYIYLCCQQNAYDGLWWKDQMGNTTENCFCKLDRHLYTRKFNDNNAQVC